VTGATATAGAGPSIERLTAAAYTVPTDRHESDGTLEWDSTTIVVVEVSAGDEIGIGWTYGAAAVERLIGDVLAPVVEEFDALALGAADLRMREALRNAGEAGAGSGYTAPTIHAHALTAVPRLRDLEWFHDHVRVERLLFDGVLEPEGGVLRPDPDRPGLGVELKRVDAERYAA
jgi:hypothetical protein